MSSPKQDKNKYFKILVDEAMQALGMSIFEFRNIDLKVDLSYQDALDKILDRLCDCNDLKCADLAIKAIDKSLKIRRGLTKLEKI